MNLSKIYWFLFFLGTLFGFALQCKTGYEVFGIAILLFLGVIHLIIFCYVENNQIKENIKIIIEVVGIVILFISTVLIVFVLVIFFLFGKIFKEPRKLAKTFQQLI